jgi:hypothetical protein
MPACVHLVGRGIQRSCDQRVDFDAQVVSDWGKRICSGEGAPGSAWHRATGAVPHSSGQNFYSGDIFAPGAALDPAGPRDPP